MKAKNIKFRINLKGDGIVNFDSSDQKWMFNGTNLNRMKTMHDNTSFAKKKFYGTPENLTYKISISSDCMRHDIFRDDVMFQSPNVINNECLLYSFIASPTSLLRGYLFADEKETLKRKGALCISDAEQTDSCDSISSIEVHSRSGKKNKDSEITDNTLFYKETIGKMEYEAIGDIDLMQLQFVSCDQIFDRFAFNSDMFKIYKQFLQTKMPSFDSELGYYQIKNSLVEIPEFGFKMTNENIQVMVKEMFEKLAKLSIRRKSSFAQVSGLEYMIVYDVMDDIFSNEEKWVKISSKKDIDAIKFETEDFYIQEDTKLAKEKRALIEADYDRRKQEGKDKKAEKKAIADAAKIAKKAIADASKKETIESTNTIANA